MEVVDLTQVTADELEDLWQAETRLWHDRLLWDVSASYEVLRRLVMRRSLSGKAVRIDGRVVAYACYVVVRQLAVIPALAVSPDVVRTGAGETLLRHSVEAMRGHGVRRIESQFIRDDSPWLPAAFAREGFRTYWNEWLRLDMRRATPPAEAVPGVSFEPWQEKYLGDCAALLQAAYAGGIEAEIHERYGTVEGCREVLESIASQGSCGPLLDRASVLACDQGQAIGFVMVTAGAPLQGHIPQVAVAPAHQGQGIGRMLLDYSVSRLSDNRYDTLSLVVSRMNLPAHKLYRAKGFQAVLTFPAFVWNA
jgi:ribosomal protein S18 acetylase RimI-like enzyme